MGPGVFVWFVVAVCVGSWSSEVPPALGGSCPVPPSPLCSLGQDLLGAFPGLCSQIVWLGLLRLLARSVAGVVQS